jgi:uncharacterized protein YrrD
MQKVNDLFGKRVISRQTGDQLATVRDVVLDTQARRIMALVIGGGRSGDEQVVRREQILGMGEFIIVDGAGPFPASDADAEIAELREGAEKITGKKIISDAGEQLGTVGDMYFSRSGAIVGFELKHGLFAGSDPQVIRGADVQAVGKDAVIVTATQPVSLSVLTEDEIETPAPGVEGHPRTPSQDPDAEAAARPGEQAIGARPPIRPVEPLQ